MFVCLFFRGDVCSFVFLLVFVCLLVGVFFGGEGGGKGGVVFWVFSQRLG